MFLQRETLHCKNDFALGPNTTFLMTTSTSKPESSDSMYSPFFMLETYDIIILPEVDWIHKILLYKFTISCEFGSVQVKWLYMFSSIKLEEYVESELSGIFWVKVVTKNIVLGSLGTHFMHMRVKGYHRYNYTKKKTWIPETVGKKTQIQFTQRKPIKEKKLLNTFMIPCLKYFIHWCQKSNKQSWCEKQGPVRGNKGACW